MSALLSIDVDRDSATSMTTQIQTAIRHRVQDGTLHPDTRLPSSRGLATDLGVSRSVVVQAYEQLTAEGYLRATQGSGTCVAPHVVPVPRRVGDTCDGRREARFDLRFDATGGSLFPGREWLVAYQRAVRAVCDASSTEAAPLGTPPLRAELARYLGRVRGVRAEPRQVVVTSRSSHLLGVLFDAVRGLGVNELAVENPGDHRRAELARRGGLRPVPVPVDERGLDVDALVRTGARAVLLTPVNQLPTGAQLSASRRDALIAWAEAEDGWIVEHDPDGDLWLGGGIGPLSLQHRCPERVAYLGSTRGVLGPRVPFAWLAVPPRVLHAIERFAVGRVVEPDGFTQLAFAGFLASGMFDQHVRQLRGIHRARRAALHRAVAVHLPGARILGAEAGTRAYVALPAGVDETGLVAAVRQRSVLIHGAADFHLDRRRAAPALVLGYGGLSHGRLTEAVGVIGSVLDRMTARLAPSA